MNYIDKKAYPEVVEMEGVSIDFLARAFHGISDTTGFVTTGSSEAIVIALSFHRMKHQQDKHDGLEKQNFVVSEAYHKIFEKYAALFNVELRAARLDNEQRVDVDHVRQLVDDRTFCIVGIMGSTEYGKADDIVALHEIAKEYDVPVHVDAAIGGFVFPFVKNAPLWDFALSSVQTINISGHKYGLCVPGVGFLMVRNKEVIPEGYNTELKYVSGGGVEDYGLSCTKNVSLLAHMNQLIESLDVEGYRAITLQNFENMEYFTQELREIPWITECYVGDTPTVIFRGEDLDGLSAYLRNRGWIQHPSYIDALQRTYIRVVVRRHVDRRMLSSLVNDVRIFYKRYEKTVGTEESVRLQMSAHTLFRGQAKALIMEE